MKLTSNFELSEFLISRTAARRGIEMDPPPEVVENLRRLCVAILQPTRDSLTYRLDEDVPFVISSGWRPVELNRAIGGADNSDHIFGRAADVTAPGLTPLELAQAFKFQGDLGAPVGQVIHEFGGWVHVSILPAGVARDPEYLTAFKSGRSTRYVTGLAAVDPISRNLV